MSCRRCSWAAVAASSDNRSMRAESLSIFLRQDDNVVGSVSESESKSSLPEKRSTDGSQGGQTVLRVPQQDGKSRGRYLLTMKPFANKSGIGSRRDDDDGSLSERIPKILGSLRLFSFLLRGGITNLVASSSDDMACTNQTRCGTMGWEVNDNPDGCVQGQ